MADAPDTLKTTPLHKTHQALGARMMAFGGFDMPVQYTSIIEEHKAVRTAAGLFDISHMGEVMVRGPKAFDYVQHLVTNDASRLYDGRAMYTVMCQPDGGIIDDLIVYRIHEEHYMLVINAANIAKDVAWMHTHNAFDVTIDDVSDETALLALQGPEAFAIAQPFTDVDLDALKFYHFEAPSDGSFMNADGVILSHTGYTGESGLEIYCAPDDAERIGQHGPQPSGVLGRRDAVLGLTWTGLVGPSVENQLAVAVAEVTQLQPAVTAAEEGVVLFDGPRPLVGDMRRPLGHGRHVGNARLDLDISRHSGQLLLSFNSPSSSTSSRCTRTAVLRGRILRSPASRCARQIEAPNSRISDE